MRKLITVLCSLATLGLCIFFSSHFVDAALGAPFGGKVTTTPQSTVPDAQCPGVSFSISPDNKAPEGPYYVALATSNISNGKSIIGQYQTSQGPCCTPSPDGCTPITTYTVTTYGAGSYSSGSSVSIPPSQGNSSSSTSTSSTLTNYINFGSSIIGGLAGGSSSSASTSTSYYNSGSTGSLPACDDLVDNDHDGLYDWFQDPGCTSPSDNSESTAGFQAMPVTSAVRVAITTTVPQCSDGIDNDADGKADYPNDPDCLSQFDNSEKPECSDGIDNNANGLIDTADSSCTSATDTREGTDILESYLHP